MPTLKKLKLPGVQHRVAEVRADDYTEKEGKKIFRASFSSEAEYERWWGIEVLGHADGEFDLMPLERTGAVLINHDPNRYVGRPVRVWIEGGRGYAEIEFSDTEAGRDAQANVEQGVLRGISVGYSIKSAVMVEDRGNDEHVYRCTWQAREISLTPIPADPSVGIGRTTDNDLVKIPVSIQTREIPHKEGAMPEPTTTPGTPAVPPQDGRTQSAPSETAVKQTGMSTEDRKRAQTLATACRLSDADFGKAMVASDTYQDFERSVFEIVKESEKAVSNQDTPRAPATQVNDNRRDALNGFTDGMLIRGGIINHKGRVLKGRGKSEVKVADNAGQFSEMGLLDLARWYGAEHCGLPVHRLSPEKLLREIQHHGRSAANTTANFATLLEDALNKTILVTYGNAGSTWQNWVRAMSANDLRAHNLHKIGLVEDLAEVNQDGEVETIGKPDSVKEIVTPVTFSGIIPITDDVFINNDMNALIGQASELTLAADRTVEKHCVYTLLSNPTMLENSLPLFNGASGSRKSNIGTDLVGPSKDVLNEIVKLMMLQESLNGEPIGGNEPAILLVPPSLLGTAETFLNSVYTPGTSNNETNIYYQRYQLIANPYLERGVEIKKPLGKKLSAAGSAAIFYALADPSILPTIVAAFYGGQAPVIEMDRPLEFLATRNRVTLRFGVAAAEYRTAVRWTNAEPGD